MPLPDELEAIPRKIKPIFFMVELTEDEIHSKDTLEFVRRIVDRIYSVPSNVQILNFILACILTELCVTRSLAFLGIVNLSTGKCFAVIKQRN